MAKTYKNFVEFIETTFPEYYEEKQYKSEPSLGDYIEDATNEFNEEIDKILKGEEVVPGETEVKKC
jgi:hypothetical protein